VDAREAEVRDLAGAILDGTPIDWRTAESTAHETERALLDQLRVLATLADFHRGQRLEMGDPERPPQTWGSLRVLEPIGSGAFGRVYRAWDTGLDREVALKLLPAGPATGDGRASSIIQEGRLLARVQHPNVVTIYGAERVGDTIGLWMERIDGETVEQRLARGPLQSPDAIEIGIQICHAVAAVHKAGLLHRDIKAQNVMLAKDGRAVLMDFGTGWDVGEMPVSGGSRAGTPLYLAPELFRDGDATIASDVYSLGVLLYHMVTGTYPVQASNRLELRLAHDRQERTALISVRRDLPPRFARIIDRAIDPRPDHRYHSADAIASALATLKPRPSIVPVKYAAAAIAALMLGGWWLVNARLRQPALATPALHQTASIASRLAKRADARAVVVLPMKNRGSESGSDEFLDGFTEELINGLAANEQLQVRSRASSFAFRDTPRNLQEIAKQLDAGLVLEGSGRRSGRRFQVEARLVQVASGVTLWNDSFESDLGEVLTVRDRNTQGVVSALGYAPTRTRRRHDANPEAYGRYLTARALVSRRGVESPKKAVEFFQQAIAIDPGFAAAYAGLADAYAYMSIPTYQGMPWDTAQALMRPAALKALALDADLAEAHAAMGIVHSRDRKWADAQHEFEQALALNPSLSQVYTAYSSFTLRPLRKFDEAEQVVRLALRNDPLSLDVWRELAEVQFTTGRYDDAIAVLRRVRTVDPGLPFTDMFLGRALVFRGRIDEALALYDTMDAEQHPVPHYRAQAYVRAGRRADAERLAAENHQYAYRATMIYTALGDLDRAFEALDRTAAKEPQRVPLLLTWPEMAPLRADPRFAALRTRFGLP